MDGCRVQGNCRGKVQSAPAHKAIHKSRQCVQAHRPSQPADGNASRHAGVPRRHRADIQETRSMRHPPERLLPACAACATASPPGSAEPGWRKTKCDGGQIATWAESYHAAAKTVGYMNDRLGNPTDCRGTKLQPRLRANRNGRSLGHRPRADQAGRPPRPDPARSLPAGQDQRCAGRYESYRHRSDWSQNR